MKYILSYPRSGNHLTRFLIEYITAGYTQGCMANVNDIPLALNEYSESDVLSHVDLSKLVALKAHSISEVVRYTNEYLYYPSGGIIIIRSPIYALASHMRDDLKASGSVFTKKAKAQLNQWKSLLLLSYKNMDFQVVWYEHLVSADEKTLLTEIRKIAKVFESDIDTDKLDDLYTSYDRLFTISASGKKRSWGGSKSIHHPDTYIQGISQENKKIICDIIHTEINNLLKNIKNEKNKFLNAEHDSFINSLQVYMKHLDLLLID